MENQDLLAQVIEVIQQQSESMKEYIDKKIEAHSTRLEIKIETDVSKRIDALFDGYKLTHEKQWEQERIIQALRAEIEEMKVRLLSIENKIA